MIRKLRVLIGIALILMIAIIGFANAKPTPLQIVRMSYATSTEPDREPTSDWTALTGNQYPVAHLTLDGNPDTWYYLTVDSFKSMCEIPTGYVYLFFLTPPEEPTFWDYWAAKGVYDGCSGSWEPIMWDIITGEKHMFGFVPTWPVGPRAGLPMLIDSLQYYLSLLGGPLFGDLRLNGDYPPGTYVFTCQYSYSSQGLEPTDILNGVTITMKIR
jgi:hypothetical protein